MIMYHYTQREFYNKIMETRELVPSSPLTTMDAAYGTGWYFTDLEPKTCDMAISFYSWRKTVLGRVEYYLGFEIEPVLLQNTREHVYLLPLNIIRNGIINLDLIYTQGSKEVIKFLGGDKKWYCSRKPCEQCSIGSKYER